VRSSFADLIEASVPSLQINIWRGCNGNNPMVRNADTCGISDEGYSMAVVEVADVMRGVSRSVKYVKAAAACIHALAASERMDILRGDRQEFSPETVHLVPIDAFRASQ